MKRKRKKKGNEIVSIEYCSAYLGRNPSFGASNKTE